VILLSVGLLVPFSFLPQKMERVGFWSALGDIVAMVAITLLLYFLAFKFGAFKNRHKIKLEKHLADWNELKRLSNDLQHE
jgi:cytochrome c-type biogenesis protein CcmH/NrfG